MTLTRFDIALGRKPVFKPDKDRATYFMGIDFGMKDPSTVCIIGKRKGPYGNHLYDIKIFEQIKYVNNDFDGVVRNLIQHVMGLSKYHYPLKAGIIDSVETAQELSDACGVSFTGQPFTKGLLRDMAGLEDSLKARECIFNELGSVLSTYDEFKDGYREAFLMALYLAYGT